MTIEQEQIGSILLSLATNSEIDDVTWQDFEQALNLWIEGKRHRIDTLINQALDDVWRRFC